MLMLLYILLAIKLQAPIFYLMYMKWPLVVEAYKLNLCFCVQKTILQILSYLYQYCVSGSACATIESSGWVVLPCWNECMWSSVLHTVHVLVHCIMSAPYSTSQTIDLSRLLILLVLFTFSIHFVHLPNFNEIYFNCYAINFGLPPTKKKKP